jgi:hypothetical protein
MDLSTDDRLQLLGDSGQASSAVIEFTRRELVRFHDELGIPIANVRAGLMVNHIVLALERARAGEPFAAPAHLAELVDAELSARPHVRRSARGLAVRALQELDAAMPDAEVDMIALHLAALIPGAGTES